ncbi:hypothetical protein SLE2022_134510 [Rubroshorea leprosula]
MYTMNTSMQGAGLVEYVKWLNTDKKPLHDVLGLSQKTEGIAIDVALQWCSDAYSDTILGHANSTRTVDGGIHIDGLKASLTRTLNNLVIRTLRTTSLALIYNGNDVPMRCTKQLMGMITLRGKGLPPLCNLRVLYASVQSIWLVV